MLDKPYYRRENPEIVGAVDRFVEYHDDFHAALEADKLAGRNPWYSVDRGTFSKPILPAETLDLLGKKRDRRSYAYGPEVGDEKLREQIAQLENLKHGTSYGTENVAMMPGAWAGLEFAIEHLMMADGGEINKKDAVLVIGPTLYQMFDRPARRFGMKMVAHDFVLPNAQHVPSLENVEDMFREKPRIIVITNPNNPDGVFIGNDTLQAIVERAAAEKVFVIVDEIQNCFATQELQYGPWIQAPHVIRVDSPAKRYAMAEYRTGWMIADPELLGKRNRGIVGAMSGTIGNAPRAGNTALSHLFDHEMQVVRGEETSVLHPVHVQLAEQEQQLVGELQRINGIAEVIHRDACINLAVRTDFAGTDMELARSLMKERTLIMPASGYGYQPSDAVLRITFAEKQRVINGAIAGLSKVLSENKKR